MWCSLLALNRHSSKKRESSWTVALFIGISENEQAVTGGFWVSLPSPRPPYVSGSISSADDYFLRRFASSFLYFVASSSARETRKRREFVTLGAAVQERLLPPPLLSQLLRSPETVMP